MEEKITINKNICIGLFISGSMAYFDDDKLEDKPIEHIEECLKKRLFVFRNGTVSFREKLKKTFTKKKKSKKDLELIKKAKFYNQRFLVHNVISNKAWVRLQESVVEHRFAINSFIIALVYKSPDAKKYYGFLQKHLFLLADMEQGASSSQKNHAYGFSSIKIVNLLLKFLQEEIDNYNKNVDCADTFP